MRRRLLAGLATAAAVILLPVLASATPSRVEHQAWSSTGVPLFASQPGELYVAAVAGSTSAKTYVAVDVSGLTSDTLARTRVQFAEAADAVFAGSASIQACALAGPLSSDGQISHPPPVDCTKRVAATRDPSGVWTVALGALGSLNTASTGRVGLALQPDGLTPAVTFRLALLASRTNLSLAPPQQPIPNSPVARTPAGSAATPSSPSTPSIAISAPPGPDAVPVTVSPQTGPTTPLASRTASPRPLASLGAPRPARALRPRGSNAGQSVLIVLVAAAAAAAFAGGVLAWRRPGRAGPLTPSPRRPPISGVIALVACCLPLLFREAIVYKAGVVLIFFVAAIGLHVLVNWAGELSLAQATMVGLPAFITLALSESQRISPIYLLPLAIVAGAALGALVALPALRARGVQVALVTLVAGIAIDTFFFSQRWLVGDAGGRAATVPSLLGVHFRTSRSLYPLLLLIVTGAVASAWALMHSKVGRAWFWVQANPDAAAAFGVPVATYRIGAYAVGGAFGGLAGGLAVMWIQRLGQGAFPAALSFSYLLVAVLAGPGFLGGLAAATVVLQGGQQFADNLFGTHVGKAVGTILTYGGALALIDMIARHQTGLNGLGRRIALRIRSSESHADATPKAKASAPRPPLLVVVGVALIAAGFAAIALAWHHISRTNQLWVQNQEILSGGLGGLGLIIVGAVVLVIDRLGRIARPMRTEDGSERPTPLPGDVTAPMEASMDDPLMAARASNGTRRAERVRGT